MVQRICALSVVLLACCMWCGRGAVADEAAPREIKAWGEAIDPDRDCTFEGHNAKFSITIPGKHHDLTYTDRYKKLNSPRVLQEVKGDFVLEVKVKAFELPQPKTSSGGDFSFVSGGLLVWQDDKNFVRLDRAAEGGSGGPFVWFERFTDGKSARHTLKKTSNEDTLLRVERKDNKLIFSTKDEGQEKWSEVLADETKFPEEVKAGVLAINTTKQEFVANFADLKLDRGE